MRMRETTLKTWICLVFRHGNMFRKFIYMNQNVPHMVRISSCHLYVCMWLAGAS